MLIKKSLYILHFKFVHFSLLLYRTLHLKEDNTIWKMARTIDLIIIINIINAE